MSDEEEEARVLWYAETQLLSPEEQMDARRPDMWWADLEDPDLRVCYWYAHGRWHWRRIGVDGEVLETGVDDEGPGDE